VSELLFLAHRMPYPPDKGDKIRSWHFLQGLARRHVVHLGAFVDDPVDWQHRPVLERVCGELCLRSLPVRLATARSALGLLNGEPLTLPYYRDRGMMRWVRELAQRRRLDGVFVFSSSMAQYAAALPSTAAGRRVLDLCDVDSDKWRQYAGAHGWPMNLVYAREARLLEQRERRYVESFDATVVIADVEADIVRRFAPRGAARVHVVANGVDTGYFDPALSYADPYLAGRARIVFTGAMDYRANVDAVAWFANEVLPLVTAIRPDAEFAIVGARPAAEVLELGRRANVRVTGRVADVRPYLAHADVVVAPLRLARGVQNKVLEAMAMAKPIVATPAAVQGIGADASSVVSTATTAREYADLVLQALGGPRREISPARQRVVQGFGWDANVARIAALLTPSSEPLARAS
jgi:sugar transferase (PEP-CTERM/EpsH1 system associated)